MSDIMPYGAVRAIPLPEEAKTRVRGAIALLEDLERNGYVRREGWPAAEELENVIRLLVKAYGYCQ